MTFLQLAIISFLATSDQSVTSNEGEKTEKCYREIYKVTESPETKRKTFTRTVLPQKLTY